MSYNLSPIRIGHRIQHRRDRRRGFVVGKPETIGTSFALIPVTIEASTRTEYWPEKMVELLPKTEQFPAHGGRFKAPPAYPLTLDKS